MSFFSILLFADMPTKEDIDRRVNAILDGPEFKSFWDRVLETVSDFLNWVFGLFDMDFRASGSDAVIALIVFVFVALLLAVLARLIYKAAHGKKKRAPGAQKAPPNVDYLRKSLASAGASDFDGAVYWLYLHSVSELGKAGRIIPGGSKTNSQYVHELSCSGFPEWRDFAELALATSRIRYGGYPAESGGYYELLAKVRSWTFEVPA